MTTTPPTFGARSKTTRRRSKALHAFSKFRELPPELRIMIWRFALLECVRPSLFFFSAKHGWRCRYFDLRSGPYPDNWRDQIPKEMRKKDKMRLPLAGANFEARDIASKWFKKQGFEFRNPQHSKETFPRCFNGELDAMHLDCYDLQEFRNKPSRLMNLLGDGQSVKPWVHQLAFHEFWLNIGDFARWIPKVSLCLNVRVFYAVVGAMPTVGRRPERWRWQLGDADGRAFVWNNARQVFEVKEGASVVGEDVYTRIELAAQTKVSVGMREHRVESLEIRPITVSRKRYFFNHGVRKSKAVKKAEKAQSSDVTSYHYAGGHLDTPPQSEKYL